MTHKQVKIKVLFYFNSKFKRGRTLLDGLESGDMDSKKDASVGCSGGSGSGATRVSGEQADVMEGQWEPCGSSHAGSRSVGQATTNSLASRSIDAHQQRCRRARVPATPG